MTLVVFGIDALDPELVDPEDHPHLTLDAHGTVDSILSTVTDEPSTHELWPTIITGLPPERHGLQLERGLNWENPIIDFGSSVATELLPDTVRSRIGSWLLNNTDEAAFRTPATYYKKNNIATIFSDVSSKTIGIPNYVVNPDEEDREHTLRKGLGDLFQHDPNKKEKHKHTSSDPEEFYHLCLEMSMIRIARTRRALRRREYELVFGYTSGLDLVGHVSYNNPEMQKQAYREMDEFVEELYNDLRPEDELVLISDHGLQDGIHTNEAMIASTSDAIVDRIDSLLDFRHDIEKELVNDQHQPEQSKLKAHDEIAADNVQQHLEDLGYM